MIEKAKSINLKKAISYKAKYIKRRHDLSVDIIGKVRKEFFEKDLALFEKKYNEFKKSIKKEKKNASDYKDVAFYNKMLEVYETE